MSGRGFALLLSAALGGAFLLSLTLVTASAVLYSLTQADGTGLGAYAAILGGCLAAWALVVAGWRRRAPRPAEGRD